jgi:hypothetical protein
MFKKSTFAGHRDHLANNTVIPEWRGVNRSVVTKSPLRFFIRGWS